MKKLFCSTLLLAVSLVFYSTNSMAIIMGAYSFVEYSAYGGSIGAPTLSEDQEDTVGSASILGGVSGSASAAAEISTDTTHGDIHSRTEARNGLNDGVKAGWDVVLSGMNPFYYEPLTWGESGTSAYLRTVWEVQSTDDSLSPGDTITADLDLSIGGSFAVEDDDSADNANTVKAVFMLHNFNDTSAWFNTDAGLGFGEYLPFGGYEDLQLTADKEYFYDNTSNTTIDDSDTLHYAAAVGDIMVLETLVESYSYLKNGGISHFAQADFSTTIHALLSTNTTGARIVQVDGSGPNPAPVPEPATILLFGVGLVGFVGFRLRRERTVES